MIEKLIKRHQCDLEGGEYAINRVGKWGLVSMNLEWILPMST